MKISQPVMILTISLVSLYGFSGCGARAKLIKRYRSIKDDTISTKDMGRFLEVSANIQNKPLSTDADKNVFDLKDKGQKALIDALASKESKSDDLLAKLSKKLSEEKDKTSITDETVFSKRIVIGAKNLSHTPADRINSLDFVLTFQDNNVQVVSCDQMVTQFGSYSAGSASFSRTSNLQATASLGGSYQSNRGNSSSSADSTSSNNYNTSSKSSSTQGNLSSTVSGTASNTTTYNEQVNLSLRYVLLNCSINDAGRSVDVFQQSISGVDLTGNAFVDITFRYKSPNTKVLYDFSDLKTPGSGGRPMTVTKPEKIAIAENYLFYPNISGDLTIKCKYRPVIRHVINGGATITEADDDISQYNVKDFIDADDITIPKNEVVPILWQIIDAHGNTLNIQSPIRPASEPLMFDSFNKAKEFLLWLKKNKADITSTTTFSQDGYLFSLNGSILQGLDTDHLHISKL